MNAWTPATRALAAAVGGGLALYGLRTKGALGGRFGDFAVLKKLRS